MRWDRTAPRRRPRSTRRSVARKPAASGTATFSWAARPGLAAPVGDAGGDATIANTGAVTVTAIGGKKIARGVHQQAAATDTIATGLATVVAVVVSWRDTPTLKQMFLTASIGDQAGAPVAGSFLAKTFKPTANNDVTPTAATDFTDNLSWNWVAIGT